MVVLTYLLLCLFINLNFSNFLFAVTAIRAAWIRNPFVCEFFKVNSYLWNAEVNLKIKQINWFAHVSWSLKQQKNFLVLTLEILFVLSLPQKFKSKLWVNNEQHRVYKHSQNNRILIIVSICATTQYPRPFIMLLLFTLAWTPAIYSCKYVCVPPKRRVFWFTGPWRSSL